MASVTGLHLQYRLWIAEMNADINVLTIFDDFLTEISAKNNSADVMNYISSFKEQFISLRNDMDELRHEMHLSKMKLAEFAKTNTASVKDVKHAVNHEELKERYHIFRKAFDKTKKAFQKFESNY